MEDSQCRPSTSDDLSKILKEFLEEAKRSGIDSEMTVEEKEVDRIQLDGGGVVDWVTKKIAGPIALFRNRESGNLSFYHEDKVVAIQGGSVVLEALGGPDPPPQAILEKRNCGSFFGDTCKLLNGNECITLQFINNHPVIKTVPLENVTGKNMLSLVNIFQTDRVPPGQPNYALYFKSSDKKKNYYLVPSGDSDIKAVEEAHVAGRKEYDISRQYLKFTDKHSNPGDNE